MALKFRRGTTAQKSGSLAFGEPYVNTTLGTLQIGGDAGDITLGSVGTGSNAQFSGISGSSLDITGNAKIDGNLTLGGTITIGDNSSDNVVVNADLSSSIIPNNDNSFDLGSTSFRYRAIHGTNIYGTINATNGVVSGSSQVIGILSSLNTYTGSNDTTNTAQNNRLTNLESATASLFIDANNLEAFTSSQNTKNATLATYTASLETKNATLATYTSSNDTTNTTQNNRLSRIEESTASLNSLTSSYARTNTANVFSGNQTITGSLYISQDLVVQGSSSIQNISSSRLDIGDNIIQLNVNQPALRFGGLAIFDSGSAGGSGSFLYDAVQDEFIFVHRGNGTNVTSSHFITGPETYDNLGNETYLTINKLPKASGKEHIVDSNITDTGTLITLGSNTVVNGTLLASGTALVSGSSQITYASISSIPAGIVSGAAQVTPLLPTGVVSGSSQVVGSSITTNTVTVGSTAIALGGSATTIAGLTSVSSTGFTGALTGNASTATTLATARTINGTSFNGSSDITIANLVSGSSQVTLSSTTGYGTVINQNLLTTSNVQHASLGIGMAASGTAGRIDAANDVVAFSSSDIRFKENIKPIENALDKISNISGNTYDWKTENKAEHGYEGNDVGVIAQEIEEVLPQLVQTRENGYKAVKYDKLVALLIEGIKEQQITISKLELEVNGLQNVITIFEDRMKEKGLL